MARCFRFLFFFILIISPYPIVLGLEPREILELIANAITTTTGIVKLVNQLWTEIHKSWRLINGQPVHTIRENDVSQNVLLAQLKHLATADQVKLDLENVRDEITSKVIETVPGLVELNRRLSVIFVNSLNVGKSYYNFLQYIQESEKFDPKILKKFALKTISEDSCGLTSLLEETHALLTQADMTTPSAIDLLMNHMELFLESSNVSKSPQQLFYNILLSTIFTEIKGFLTMQYSYGILSFSGKRNYEGHIEKMESDFAQRINETLAAFQKITSIASREVWKDDPLEHIDGVTFTELKYVFQQYVANERDISTNDKCEFTCSRYNTPTDVMGDNCFYKDICAHQRICEGYLYGCTTKSQVMKICPLEKNNTRRYQYIEDMSDGHRSGSQEQCPTDPILTESHSIFWQRRRCDPCICVCADTSTKAVRFFNLDPSMARFEENYVVTGVRFVKKDNIIHIQIQEGQLLPNGNINQSTVAWIPIKDKPNNLHSLEWSRRREINLDDLEAPKNHVLIGLSFHSQMYESNVYQLNKRLQLKIFSTPLNFTSGKLLMGSFYQRELFSELSTDEVDLNDLDIPTRNAVKSLSVKSKPNQYLKFGTTGLEQDVGQSTIPFIDMQNITTYPASPMAGAGIYHRQKSGKGGFLALRLFTFDVSNEILANFPRQYEYTHL